MATRRVSILPPAMMTRWRRRQLCVLERPGTPPTPAVIRAIDGNGAQIDCVAPPVIGEEVAIRHPEAGRIGGRVLARVENGVVVALARDAAAVAFALAVVASDMSNPA